MRNLQSTVIRNGGIFSVATQSNSTKFQSEILEEAEQLWALIINPDVSHVTQICAAMNINHKRLLRLSRQSFGATPKLLLRQQRFERTITAMRARSNRSCGLHLDPAYVDQSHFIRDSHKFVGMAPGRYLAQCDHMAA